jgi:uncharacterized membrane protein
MHTVEPLAATRIIPAKQSMRVASIDFLRGIVMIIMALDHTRDFFHTTAWTDDPLNFATTTPALFLTRWITHFCAPVFVFLSGTSVWFQSLRKSKKELSFFLIKRGLWLILIEITLVNFAFSFDIHFSIIGLQTIWAIGISMVILGLMIWLPFPAILAIGLFIIFGHNSLDFYEAKMQSSPGWWYDLIHHPGYYHLWGKHYLLILYPFLSWAGLMMVGYCFGKIFTRYQGSERRKILAWSGITIVLFFIVVRATNWYGNPEHWANQKSFLFTVLSFIDTHKYPPSLLYMCMTIGPAILFIAWFGDIKNKLTGIITVYGRVPFFYYVLHFYLIHFVSAFFFLARGHSFAEGLKDQPGLVPKFIDPAEGTSLFIVYVIWICIVASLYPLCRWYDKYKANNRQKWWLSYL